MNNHQHSHANATLIWQVKYFDPKLIKEKATLKWIHDMCSNFKKQPEFSLLFCIPFPLGKLEFDGTVGGNECWETNRTKSSSATGNFPNSRDSIKPPLLMETARVILSKKSQTPDSSHTDLSIELWHILVLFLTYFIICVAYFRAGFLSGAPHGLCILHTSEAWGGENSETGLEN